MSSTAEAADLQNLTASAATTGAERPLVSMLLIAFNQADVVADAVRGALAQTYSPLEILISDDGSTDGTFDVIQRTVRDYRGPHRIVLNRNERNEGISAHLSKLARMSAGELMVVAAGDDVSLPQRCERLVDFWLSEGRRPDLIASDLIDLDDAGGAHGRLSPTDLGAYRSFDDWITRRPYVVGAAHAWSRRLFERFGDMIPGAMAEDLIMTFRAVMLGGARSLPEPLVMYRRGGLSRKRRWRSVDEFVARIRQTNRFALAEIEQFQRDADKLGVGERMHAFLAPKRARECFTRDMFAAHGLAHKIRLVFGTTGVKTGFKWRIFLYAACPGVYAPFFALKRLVQGLRGKKS